MKRMSNDAVFKAAKRRIWDLVWPNLYEALVSLAHELIQSAEFEKEYMNLTGNTLTSYAVGIYKDGALIEIIQNSNLRPPVRVKLTRGEVWEDFRDYDGNFRKWFVGIVETDSGWGDETSINFLTSYDPPFRSSKTGIVMCTGTEYSEFLEWKSVNVLTAIPVAATVSAIAAWALPMALGSAYLPSVPILRVLLAAIPIIYFYETILNSLYADSKQNRVVIIRLVGLITSLLLNVSLLPKYGIMGGAWAALINELLMGIVFFAVLPSLRLFFLFLAALATTACILAMALLSV